MSSQTAISPRQPPGVFLCLLLLALLAAAGCATDVSSPRADSRDAGDFNRSRRTASSEAAPAPAVPSRPGLGTEFGEERESRVRPSEFVRADRNRPLATAAVYYDNDAGVRAQVEAAAGSFAEPPPAARGLVDLTVRDGATDFALRTVSAGGRRLVVGAPGKRYTVKVRNRTDARLEVVLSVDGLDVLDGRPASYRKAGYLLPPRGRVRVEGFRTSTDTVAAFRFAAVRNSYAAQRYGDTRNVGVIDAAIFAERGRPPFGGDEETERRCRADPFPGRGPFAEPPRRY